MWGLLLFLNCALFRGMLMTSIYSNSCLTISGVFLRSFAITQFHSKSFVVKKFLVGCKKIVKAVLSCLRQLHPAPAFKAPKKSHTHCLSPRDPSSSLSPPPVLDIFTLGSWLWLWGDVAKGKGCSGSGSSDLGLYLLHFGPDIGQTPQQ